MAKTNKVIVTAAVTGAIHTSSMSPYLPCGIEGIANAAIEAAKAGASIVHIHAREENGKPTSDLDFMGEILKRIKAGCDAVIGITTGAALGMSVEERIAAIPRFKPELASFNSGSINFNLEKLTEVKELKEPKYAWEIPFLKATENNVFRNTFYEMKRIAQMFDEAGTVPEFEVFDLGQVNNIAYLYEKGYVKPPFYFQFVPGILGGIPIRPDTILFFVNEIKRFFGEDANFSMVSGGRRMYRYETLSAILGGNVRVGFEDGLYISSTGELAKSNAEQVQKMVGVLKSLDFEIATPEDARKTLNTKGKDKVCF
ncbi:MAG: 3-keto-5-aminohexanoate cleavage protein [Lachnospiraceae bacterium]|nr:3-keto-5-aminohexanoate cleavage protein [Lachnospiraceae bacterium]